MPISQLTTCLKPQHLVSACYIQYYNNKKNKNLAVSALDLWPSKIWGIDGQYWALTIKKKRS